MSTARHRRPLTDHALARSRGRVLVALLLLGLIASTAAGLVGLATMERAAVTVKAVC